MAEQSIFAAAKKISPLHRLWPWNPYDTTTWFYSDYKVKKVNDELVITEWIKNPHFRYEI